MPLVYSSAEWKTDKDAQNLKWKAIIIVWVFNQCNVAPVLILFWFPTNIVPVMSCHYLKDHKYYEGTECFGGELVQQVCQTREATLKHPLLLSTTSTLVRYQKSKCVWKKKINVLYLVLNRSFHHLTLFTRHISNLWRRGGETPPRVKE